MAALIKGKHKRPQSPRLVAICDIQPRMLDGYFEGMVLNRYGSFDQPGNKYKCIHVDLSDREGLSTIILSAADRYAHQYSPMLHVGLFVRVTNFNVYLKNGMFEFGDSSHSLRVGSMTLVENIPPFPISLSFLPTHSTEEFMRRECLNELGTLELVVVGIHGREKKQFILVVADSTSNVHTFVFYHEFYAQYLQLCELYSKGEIASFQIKNVTSATHGENFLSTIYSSIFVIPVPEEGVIQKLKGVYEVHHFERPSIAQFEVWF
jgi:hypothetical protein